MAYGDFTLSGLTKQFGLTIDETTDLYEHIGETSPDPYFIARLAEDERLALAVSTEKVLTL